MMIFQVHEKHGKHIAYSPQEATYNESKGWKTVSEKEFFTVNKGKPVSSDRVVPESDSSPAVKYEQKFGKPPHHRMKPETIEAALRGENDDGSGSD